VTLWFDTTDVWDWSSPQLTGVQRVVVHVLGEILRSGAEVRLFRFDRTSRALLALAPDELAPGIQKHCGLPPGRTDGPRAGGRRFWPGRLPALRRWRSRPPTPPGLFKRGDVCLSLSLTWGFWGYWEAIAAHKRVGVKVVQLLHDITFVVHPQWVLPDWTVMGTEWLRDVTEQADLLLVTSQFQRAEVERYLGHAGLPRRPIEVVTLGDDPPGLTPRPGAAPARRPRAPFVLCVSGFYPRKNHHALYHVWRRLALRLGDRCPFLLLVGEVPRMPFELLSQIERDPLTRDRVLVWLDVDDDELAHLFRDCLFTVYPSHYEGWGLPVAESLRLGRYCIASSASSLPEVGGDLVDYVDPFDHLGLYDRIEHALENPGYVREREAAIRARYRPRSWTDTARRILSVVSRETPGG